MYIRMKIGIMVQTENTSNINENCQLTPIKLRIDFFTQLENLGKPGKPRVIPDARIHKPCPEKSSFRNQKEEMCKATNNVQCVMQYTAECNILFCSEFCGLVCSLIYIWYKCNLNIYCVVQSDICILHIAQCTSTYYEV